jgi:hypothetical protein
MKIYYTHSKKGKIFQLEYEVEKLHRRGNDFIVYLKSKNGITSYPAFWLSDCVKNVESAMFYKFSKRQMKIVQRNW